MTTEQAASLDAALDTEGIAHATITPATPLVSSLGRMSIDSFIGEYLYNEIQTVTLVFGSERLSVPAGMAVVWQVYVEAHVTFADGAGLICELNTDGLTTSTSQAAAMKAKAVAFSFGTEITNRTGLNLGNITLAARGRSVNRGTPAPGLTPNPTPTTEAMPTETTTSDAPAVNGTGTTTNGASATPASSMMTRTKPSTILGQEEAKEVIRAAVKTGLHVLLTGHTGCGKTGIVDELAYSAGKNLIRINLNGQTGVDEIVGRYVLTANGGATVMTWIDGPLTLAMRNGDWILFDEINAALPEVVFVLQSVLDDARALRLVEKDGSVIHAHPGFRCFGSRNPSDEYAGTKDLNPALASRFKVKVNMDYPEAAIESTILTSRTGVSAADAAYMVELGARLRNHKKLGAAFTPVGTRDLLGWSELTVALGGDRSKAFMYSILNAAGDDRALFEKEMSNVDADFVKFTKKHGPKDPVSVLAEIEAKVKAIKDAEADAKKIRAKAVEEAKAVTEGAELRKQQLVSEIAELESRLAEKQANAKDTMMSKLAQMLAEELEKGS